MHIGSFIHSLTRNILRYFLIGYICGELLTRLLYDWVHIGRKRGNFYTILYRPIDRYSFKANIENNCFIRSKKKRKRSNNSWLNIPKYLDRIYQCDATFRFTTIVICTYTVALIFLFHLTGTIILLYQYQTKNPIRYAKQFFEYLLNIGMN